MVIFDSPDTTCDGERVYVPVCELAGQRPPAPADLRPTPHLPDRPTTRSASSDAVVSSEPALPSELAASSELTEQLEELDRCLERMDAVMAMLEADLDRRDAAMRALFENTGAEAPQAARATRTRNRKSRTRRSRTRARTRRGGSRRAKSGRRA